MNTHIEVSDYFSMGDTFVTEIDAKPKDDIAVVFARLSTKMAEVEKTVTRLNELREILSVELAAERAENAALRRALQRMQTMQTKTKT